MLLRETGTMLSEDETEELSRLIGVINDRFATANNKENFLYVLEPALDEALFDRHAK